ncbi:MAG TPA: glycoside hydrolase family 125 protein [Candidatus Eisenbergiella intestinipullorum]|nr:glycoside hydrolase family 125 protein [Candidatus Eisenbergiella intestinipullorum]
MELTQFMREKLEEDCRRIPDRELAELYRNCFRCTWETTLSLEEGEKTYIITGDIEAMWLRDSSMQVLPYLRYLEDETVKRVFRGLIRKQAELILTDPYANAFNKKGDFSCFKKDHTEMGPFIWERKYEVDSLAFPIFLLEAYYGKSGDRSVLTEQVISALETVLAVWKKEQHHGTESDYSFERDSELITETLQNGGKGTPVGYTGMTWSGFRPSDDACRFHYLIPSNMLAVSVLRRLAKLPVPEEMKARAAGLAEQIAEGIRTYGITQGPSGETIYAYETDGLGHDNRMDDANLPSLLGAPWYGFCEAEDPLYLRTRKFLLSGQNPCYFQGKYAAGIGSPHTPDGYVWHIALIVQGLTASSSEEKAAVLETLKRTDAGAGHMHEGFDPDRPDHFTRPWFAWADSMFCLLAEDFFGLS